MGRASRNLYRIWWEKKSARTRERIIQTQLLISTYCLFLAIAKRQTDISYVVEIMTIDCSSSINNQLNIWDNVLTSFLISPINESIYIYIYRLYKLIIRLLPLCDPYANESMGRMYAIFFCLFVHSS